METRAQASRSASIGINCPTDWQFAINDCIYIDDRSISIVPQRNTTHQSTHNIYYSDCIHQVQHTIDRRKSNKSSAPNANIQSYSMRSDKGDARGEQSQTLTQSQPLFTRQSWRHSWSQSGLRAGLFRLLLLALRPQRLDTTHYTPKTAKRRLGEPLGRNLERV